MLSGANQSICKVKIQSQYSCYGMLAYLAAIKLFHK